MQISFQVCTLMIFGRLEAQYSEELKNYFMVDNGYNSFPTNISGTLYRKALQDEKGEVLIDDQIADNIIGTLFADEDTTAGVMTWIVKYLHDNPKLLEAVKAEHKAIERLIEKNNQPLSWSHTRNMPITHKVILETQRMASIISFTFREAVVDVEYKGYLIPKGWKVMLLFRNIHRNPEFFADPRESDPLRLAQNPTRSCHSAVECMPVLETSMQNWRCSVTHHLVSNFRWEAVGTESGIQNGPFPVPCARTPHQVFERNYNIEKADMEDGCGLQ
ncbi:Abscisic acid 8'-hydroxylase 4 [Hibiscus syriacus]|uniref:Abscisic acid 8'-hydroxylase 4 n=1 Tax=Hibiscus syriacus TaxID=106335 RepID=A0A6A3BRP3_HIBSY|nr:Abscisic acid 8'-hydroxylase 4 [Hibiscus syriacus]